MIENKIIKIKPHPDYPCEDGRFVRGNDYSPVAVAIILICEPEKMPKIGRGFRTGLFRACG